jgi:competence CoiA-like predicted nuclease
MVHKLQYALKNSVLTNISEVESGLKCNCVCPCCGSQLVAKKGKRKIFHFAHYNSEECKGGYETSIHLLAKEIISEEMQLTLPPLYLNFPGSYKESELLFPEKTIDIDNVYLENRIENIIPDIVVECKNAKLLVEIFVTHDVDKSKLEKIKKVGISTISINLSDLEYSITKEELKNIIINDTSNKRWIYNNKEEKLYNRFKQKARAFESVYKDKGVFCQNISMAGKGFLLLGGKIVLNVNTVFLWRIKLIV